MTEYVLKSKCDTKIGNLELKIPDVSGLLQTSSFNNKVNELENKIKTTEQKPNISNLATISSVTAVLNKILDVTGFVKKTDYATEISNVKYNYVTNAALTSQLNDLKSKHIADEVKKIDDKTKKNSTDILGFESRLKKKEDTLNDLERVISYCRGKDYYLNLWLVYKTDLDSFVTTTDSSDIENWKSKGKNNISIIGCKKLFRKITKHNSFIRWKE